MAVPRRRKKNIQMEITRNRMEKKKEKEAKRLNMMKKAANMRKLTEW